MDGFRRRPATVSPTSHAKTLWDWLQLFIVPAALALAAFALSSSQARREIEREDARAGRERAAVMDRAREDALDRYLQQMADLITEHRLRSAPRPRVGAYGARISDEVALARTLTLTVLGRLDGERKGVVLRFLQEADLLSDRTLWRLSQHGWRRDRTLAAPRVDLAGADLRFAVMQGAELGLSSDES